jgi:hypothetical protein
MAERFVELRCGKENDFNDEEGRSRRFAKIYKNGTFFVEFVLKSQCGEIVRWK